MYVGRIAIWLTGVFCAGFLVSCMDATPVESGDVTDRIFLTATGHDGAAYGQVWTIDARADGHIECRSTSEIVTGIDPIEIIFDDAALFQALFNLVTNEVDSMEPGVFTGQGFVVVDGVRTDIPDTFFSHQSGVWDISAIFPVQTDQIGCFVFG